MGVEHLEKLENALSAKGWSVLQREHRIDWKYAGIWEIQRSKRAGPFHLRFVAMDGLGSPTVRDLPAAWCCELSEGQISLYFSRLRNFDPKLRQFLTELDGFETEEIRKNKSA
jgi:hypothetical protein